MIVGNSENMDFKKLVEEYLIEKPFWNMILEDSYVLGRSKNNKPDDNGIEKSCWEGFDLIASCHHFNYGRTDPEFNNLLDENHTTIQWKPYIDGISLDYCDDTWFISEKLKQPMSLNSKSNNFDNSFKANGYGIETLKIFSNLAETDGPDQHVEVKENVAEVKITESIYRNHIDVEFTIVDALSLLESYNKRFLINEKISSYRK